MTSISRSPPLPLLLLTDEHGDLADGDGDSERADGLPLGRLHLEGGQEGDDAVLGDGLQQPRRAGQRLEAGADGGEQGADLDHLRVGPGDVAHHQAAAYALAEPGWRRRVEPIRLQTGL